MKTRLKTLINGLLLAGGLTAAMQGFAGTTTRVSVASDGTQGMNYSENPSISADGRYVAFASYANNLVANDTNGRSDVFVHDRQTGETTRVSVASDGSGAILFHTIRPSVPMAVLLLSYLLRAIW